MTTNPARQNSARRQACTQCLRALCICHLVQVKELPIRLVIWQHPDEVHHVKGSGRLLHLCLPNSLIVSAEQVTLPQLLELAQVHDQAELALLYPNDELAGPFATPNHAAIAQIKTLIVLDASWRDSRQILRSNPYLLSLPRYALQQVYTSRYRIRKAHKAGQLSSMEAACYAMHELLGAAKLAEKSSQAVDLLGVFDAFVELQAAYFRP